MRKHERKHLPFSLILLTLICAALLSGCGDSNMFESLADDTTTEAQVSNAVDALNSGDYNAAVAILEGMDTTDPEIKKYLASAYIGSTGFDTLKLIETMGDDVQNQTSTDGGVFTTVNELLGFENGVVDLETLGTKIETAQKALDLLVPAGVDTATLSDEAKFQAGLYAAVEVLYVTERILEGNDPLLLTNTEIGNLVTQNFAADATILSDLLALVVMASDTLIGEFTDPSVSNDVQQSLDEFLVEIGYLDNIVDRNIVGITSDKLSTYITNQAN